MVMSTYKIKSILKNSLVVEYRKNNGDLVEFDLFIESDWDQERIETEISYQKQYLDSRDTTLKLDQYFSKGEEREFISVPSTEELIAEEEQRQKEHNRLLQEKDNQEFLDIILRYRSEPLDYKGARLQEYPTTEEQLDALYWMRQGIMEPIQEIDKKIKEIKEKYPKDQPTNLTVGDLDDMFPDTRQTFYKDELKARGIQVDFLE